MDSLSLFPKELRVKRLAATLLVVLLTQDFFFNIGEYKIFFLCSSFMSFTLFFAYKNVIK